MLFTVTVEAMDYKKKSLLVFNPVCSCLNTVSSTVFVLPDSAVVLCNKALQRPLVELVRPSKNNFVRNLLYTEKYQNTVDIDKMKE